MTTQVIPAIDLRQGRVVRLRQGDYAQQTNFDVDPAVLAGQYRDAGATWLHVVDLDGARDGGFANLAYIEAIAKAGLQLQAGGGVRDAAGIERLHSLGVSRVVVGSIAVREPDTVSGWLARFGAERLTIALDTRWREGAWQLPHAGWTEQGGATLKVLAPLFAKAGAVHLLCTDIDRDGMMAGPNLALYQRLAALAPGLQVQASGGVRSAADVAAVAAAGIAGVILGRALLQGSLALADAFAAAGGVEA